LRITICTLTASLWHNCRYRTQFLTSRVRKHKTAFFWASRTLENQCPFLWSHTQK